MRHADWERRLTDLVAATGTLSYAYGSWDCAIMPLAVIEAVTGKDHGRRHRGKYKSKIGATRYLKALGFASVEAALDSILDEKPVGFAQRGDLVLATDGIPAVCMGAVALSVGQDGWAPVARSDWVKAWRVGPRRNSRHRRRKAR